MSDRGVTRREVIAGAVGAIAAAGCRPSAAQGGERTMESQRMPVAFVSHGGGPWPVLDLGFGSKDERDSLLQHLRDVGTMAKPKAILVISAHWEEAVPTVMSSPRPPMLYDYYGFPPEAYTLSWPAPGDPALAQRVRSLLEAKGFATKEDAQRGFDHGTFVPLKVAFPAASVPTVQLSMIRGLDPAQHLAMGRALAPLRDEGVLIVGSGNTFHNLRAIGEAMHGSSVGHERAAQFDAWVQSAATAEPAARDAQLARWDAAPFARFVQPREDHLIPLMVAAGAAGEDRGAIAWSGALAGLRGSGFRFG